MKDRRLTAFGVMLAKRRRLAQTLRETLIAQRAELDEAAHFAQQKRCSLDEARTVLDGCDHRVEAMLSGHEAMSLPAFNQLREYRVVLLERVAAAETELRKAEAELARRGEALDKTRADIVRNEGQIAVIEERIEKIEVELERAQGDVQDEEIEEIMVARLLRLRSASTIDRHRAGD